jgi:hypothetical protein
MRTAKANEATATHAARKTTSRRPRSLVDDGEASELQLGLGSVEGWLTVVLLVQYLRL